MKQILISIIFLSASIGSPCFGNVGKYQQLYSEMELEGIVDYVAFEQAMTGYDKLVKKSTNQDILTLIDYSKPSTEKRFYVLDIKHKKILFNTHVSHGKKSGENYATSFSNKKGSNKSSLGFFRTDHTYEGRNGYSLILNGLEKGVNDQARARSIVIHGAAYCNPDSIPFDGRLGRSLGCPALPETICEEIIDTIKEGTLLYIYANNISYKTKNKAIVNRSR